MSEAPENPETTAATVVDMARRAVAAERHRLFRKPGPEAEQAFGTAIRDLWDAVVRHEAALAGESYEPGFGMPDSWPPYDITREQAARELIEQGGHVLRHERTGMMIYLSEIIDAARAEEWRHR